MPKWLIRMNIYWSLFGIVEALSWNVNSWPCYGYGFKLFGEHASSIVRLAEGLTLLEIAGGEGFPEGISQTQNNRSCPLLWMFFQSLTLTEPEVATMFEFGGKDGDRDDLAYLSFQ